MTSENVTPSQERRDDDVRWSHPNLTDKIGRRVGVDWRDIPNPGPKGEYKITGARMSRVGKEEAEVMIVVDGKPKKWWVPIGQIFNNED